MSEPRVINERLTQPYRCRYNGLQVGEGDVALPELLR
jgi:hypothetical protein